MADTSNTSPSQTILERIFGRTPSDPEFDKRMELAKQKMQTEMPNEMNNTDIEPIGPLGRLGYGIIGKVLGSTPIAKTGRFGGISYDPRQMENMDQNDIEDTLTHELTHVKQLRDMPLQQKLMESVMPLQDEGLPAETEKSLRDQGWNTSYRGKANEMEAYDAEDQRKLRTQRGFPGQDINLPSSKKTRVNVSPSKKVMK